MQLTAHFALEEFTISATALRLGIDNTAPPLAVANLQRLARDVLEPLRAKVGAIIVTSGYRCVELNRAIGGAPGSHHLDGSTADIKVPGMAPADVCAAVLALGLPIRELIHEYGQWSHVSAALMGNAARSVLTIDRLGTRHGLWSIRA